VIPGAATLEAVAGTFHGLPTVGLTNGLVRVEALATAGPRIVRLACADGVNLLAETPDVAWDTPRGRYRLLGGHRLWIAPEDPERSAAPDDDGVSVERLGDGLRLTGTPEAGTGIVRSIEVRLDPALPVLTVLHEVRNAGARTLEASPWAITQLPLGGRALVPQPMPAPGHDTRPNRILVLWPYSSWEDPRLRLRDGLLSVEGDAGPDLKVGCAADAGWIAWVREGTALVRRFDPVPGADYPDLGCNAEVYTGERYLELEVLGPLGWLAPGESATLAERWEVHDVRELPAGDVNALRETLARPITGTPAAPSPAWPMEA
jgi:hypothetical protein